MAKFDALRVIVFGSHARGDTGPDGDVDPPAVLPSEVGTRGAAIRSRRARVQFPVNTDAIVTAPEEIGPGALSPGGGSLGSAEAMQ